jgi:hypothetical protein
MHLVFGFQSGSEEMSMNRLLLSIGLVVLSVFPVFAQDKEQDRVENSGKVMKEILDAPDSIPQSVLDKADCVVVLPSVLKFAIGIGGSYGRGVMTCRGGKTFKGRWGAPAMMALEGGSFGLQLGGQATDFVLLLMNSRAASSILSSKVKLGGDASALSQQRADTVRDYLVSQGLSDNTVTATGFGKSDPVADNDTPAGRQQNRRVEIVVSGEIIGVKIGK